MNLKRLKKFRGYFANITIIWVVYFLYHKIPFYTNFLRIDSFLILLLLAISYTSAGAIYYSLMPKEKIKKTKGEHIFSAIKKIIRNIERKIKESPKEKIKLEKIEKTSFLFASVKIFFLPIMINFVLTNFIAIKNQLPQILKLENLFSIPTFNHIIFPLILALIFFFDTLWFAFGYAAEAGFLKNKIRSVEPTFIGWFVALICYPPFNGYLTNLIGWYANDYVLFPSETLTFVMRLLAISFLSVYVSATFALGTKCSNLTNRGIVSRGPYSIIRHPAYISKNLAWWVTVIPVLSFGAILSMGTWSLIYHFRSITEERHLKKDPDYIEYTKKVKYRYLPGIY